MAKTTLDVGAGFYVSDALPISAQRCVNWYVNKPQTSTITQSNLFPVPGIELLGNVSQVDTTRGAHVFKEIPYFVIGTTLYRLNQTFPLNVETFDLESLGTIEGVGRVFITDNGTEMCIVAPPDDVTAGKSYIFTDDPDTLTEITDPNFDGPASSVVFIDGFFVFSKANDKKFFNSPLNAGLGPYDPLDFSTAEADPDNIRVLVSYRNQLYVFGSETVEIFRNIGRAPAPFQRISGAVIDVGCTVPQSAKLFAGGIAFVGQGVNERAGIWLIVGGQKTKLSTTAIDNVIADIAELDAPFQAFSTVYADRGNFFYSLSLQDTTLFYDQTSQTWAERRSQTGLELGRYRVADIVRAYGRFIVGDLQDGRVGSFNNEVFTEYNILVRRLFSSRPFDQEGDPIFMARLEAVIESGKGLTNDITLEAGTKETGVPILVTGGSDPQITYSFSDDGGRIFKGFIARSMGKKGEYNIRPIWRRLGRFPRSRVIQIEVASPTDATIIKLEADVA